MPKKKWDKPRVIELDVLMTEKVYSSWEEFKAAFEAMFGEGGITPQEYTFWNAHNSFS